MESHSFGRFLIEYDIDEDLPVILYDETGEIIDQWDNLSEARLDIDYSPIGEEITLEQWQGLWDWVEGCLRDRHSQSI